MKLKQIEVIEEPVKPLVIREHPIKHGKGKLSRAALIVRNYQNRGGYASYEILHAPSEKLIESCYFYLSTARGVAQEIVLTLGGDLFLPEDELLPKFTEALRSYIRFYSMLDVKNVVPFEEWQSGPDYTRIVTEKRATDMAQRIEAEYGAQLAESDCSLCYMATPGPGLAGADLAALIEGRRTDREMLLLSTPAKV